MRLFTSGRLMGKGNEWGGITVPGQSFEDPAR